MKTIDPAELLGAMTSDFAQECLLMALQDGEHFDGRDELIEGLQEIENRVDRGATSESTN